MAETLDPQKLKFTGKLEYQPQAGEIDPDTQEKLYPYLATASPGLIKAVNLAIRLKRPLLLEGEPGCGKTKLARAVALEFSKRYGVKYPYSEWYVKSTEQARDGLYTYDAVRRLYDAQLATTDSLERNNIHARLTDPTHQEYITWGAIGEAFRASREKQRMVVLIDEIDKADPDFANDLLLELEEKRFFVKERSQEKEIRALEDFAPIIFITSNAQRQLPDAFLRRCLFYYVKFPNRVHLKQIIEKRFGKLWTEDLVNKALDRFLALRQAMEEEKGDFGKKISISELQDWFQALSFHRSKLQVKKLLEQRQIPYASTLLKTKDDLEAFAEVIDDDEEE